MRKYGSVIIIVFSLFIWSCQKEPDSAELIDQMVVSTNYDPDADFDLYGTYALPTDTIGFLSNSSSDTIITASESDFPGLVLEKVTCLLQKDQEPVGIA